MVNSSTEKNRPKTFRPEKFSAEKISAKNVFGRKIFMIGLLWTPDNTFLVPKDFSLKNARPKNISAENFSAEHFSSRKSFGRFFFDRKIFRSKISPSVSPKAEALGGFLPPRSVRRTSTYCPYPTPNRTPLIFPAERISQYQASQ